MKNKDARQKSKPPFTKVFKWWQILIAVILLISTFTTLSLLESARQSATADEVAHIPAGISYVQTGDFRMNTEHPVLIKYLSGLSAQAFSHPVFSQKWQSWKLSDEWNFGRQLLYFTPKNNADEIVFWARIPVLIIAIGLGLVIFFWASSMFGQVAGLVALGFYCLDPTMIAFSHLVTFDLPMAAFVATSAFCLWLAFKRRCLWGYVFAGFFLGLALISKVSSLSFALIIPLLLIPATLDIEGNRFKKAKFYSSRLGITYATTIITIWLGYFLMLGNNVWHIVGFLPASYAHSLGQGLVRYQATKLMYLDGYLSGHGHWWYFPGSFLAKSTLALLVFLIIGLSYFLSRIIKNRYNWLSASNLYLVVPAVLIAIPAMVSQFDIGLRMIFIIYPFIFILAGYVVSLLLRRFYIRNLWIWAVLIYYLFTLVTAFPNYLAYSNELFGGRANSYKYLADSNLDWGQGLKELKNYADKNHINNLPIIYFGDGAPEYYGLKPIFESNAPLSLDWLKQKIPPNGGWLAVSASIANYCGLNKLNYQIDSVYPKDVVAGSILIYKLPPSRH